MPEKSNIWRDCVDGYYDWVKEHVAEGAPLNESDHCGDPPLVLAAGNGHLACVKLLINEGADIQQAGVVRCPPSPVSRRPPQHAPRTRPSLRMRWAPGIDR